MRGNLSPFSVCWFLDLLESPCLNVLYLVVDRVTGFASNGSSISNKDVNFSLCFGGALVLCFNSFTVLEVVLVRYKREHSNETVRSNKRP